METEKISEINLKEEPGGSIINREVMPGEIEGVLIEQISVKGEAYIHEPSNKDIYDILFFLSGEAAIKTAGEQYIMGGKAIARIPYNKPYVIQVKKNVRKGTEYGPHL